MSLRVLMIEDDQNLAGMVAEYLGTMGMKLTIRATAADGLKTVRQGGVEAVILDVMLPDLDGFEICRRIKRELRLTAPVVMMTSRNTKRDRMQGVLVEADDYLVKPVQHQELEAVLSKYLGE